MTKKILRALIGEKPTVSRKNALKPGIPEEELDCSGINITEDEK